MKKYTEPSISIKRFDLENIVTTSVAVNSLKTMVGGVEAADYGSVTAESIMKTN